MDDTITLDQFRLWNVNAIKAYLHVRGKNTDGGLEELGTYAKRHLFASYLAKEQGVVPGFLLIC